MPKCQPCLSKGLKEAIRNATDDPHTLQQIDRIPECPVGEIMELCGKVGHKRSAYQEFTSQCLKAKHLTKFDPNAIKDCAAKWREQKPK